MTNNLKDIINIDSSRDRFLTDFGKKTLENRYLIEGESYQDAFARVSYAFSDNMAHAQRIYDYISNMWFMPATPVISNGGTTRGLPISCFLNETEDSMQSIVNLWTENVWLGHSGGGIGSYWGNIRSIGEKIKGSGATSGVIPFIKVMDSMTLAVSQGSLRRGAGAVYLPISHPEIEEFIEIRKPTGGDHNRKSLNLNHGVCIPDAFMRAVENGEQWALRSPKDNHIVEMVNARELWIRILTARMETGEPYLLFTDTVNRAISEHHKLANLTVKTSNLCSEITLPTGVDYNGKNRTAVCCLSSLNLEKFKEWESHSLFIEDCLRFLDNVLQNFINTAPAALERAKYAATQERSVGLGVMGFHSFLQENNIPFESIVAKVWNKRIMSHIKKQADEVSIKLAQEKGACPDAQRYGKMERFSNKIAVAPTATISTICGNTSPGIEPFVANAFNHKTLSGSFAVKNRSLTKILKNKGKDTNEIWTDIFAHGGSVQQLNFLNNHEKLVFKTAFEIDQKWLVEHAADRQPFVCQAQSLNIFMPADVHKKTLHDIHMLGWKKGVKSFYYVRSRSLQRAESIVSGNKLIANKELNTTILDDSDECLSCQ